jgi:type-F conjugative transfer system pilin assembly protein TrbC
MIMSKKYFYYLIMMSMLVGQFAFAKNSVSQDVDYHAMVRELEANANAELAKIPKDKQEEYKTLARDLASGVKINDQDNKELLELSKKVTREIQSTEFVPEKNLLLPTDVQDKQIYIFVSSSMKKPNLIRLGKQAAAQGASLVMRGFVENSYLKTAAFLKEVIEKTGQGVAIDPSLFKAYRVTEVPTFVMVDGSSYDKISGNISLDYAIQEIRNKGEVFKITTKHNENN